jgi:plastocyanin
MKNLIFSLIILFALTIPIQAKQTVTISGFKYLPEILTVELGEDVTIEASTFHPLVQVDRATWFANGATQMSGGWGSKTSNYEFTVSGEDTIYYVCSNHVSSGMKGRIVVQKTSGVDDLKSASPAFSISPNPISSHAELIINSVTTSEVTIKLYDFTGKFVKNINTNNLKSGINNYNIDVSDLNNGEYFIAVSDKNQQFIEKIAVMK